MLRELLGSRRGEQSSTMTAEYLVSQVGEPRRPIKKPDFTSPDPIKSFPNREELVEKLSYHPDRRVVRGPPALLGLATPNDVEPLGKEQNEQQRNKGEQEHQQWQFSPGFYRVWRNRERVHCSTDCKREDEVVQDMHEKSY
jgi:hypothetical protein